MRHFYRGDEDHGTCSHAAACMDASTKQVRYLKLKDGVGAFVFYSMLSDEIIPPNKFPIVPSKVPDNSPLFFRPAFSESSECSLSELSAAKKRTAVSWSHVVVTGHMVTYKAGYGLK